MAEVLGVIGSVIGIAQLAGKILTTGIKLRGILKDMHDIPDEILFHLEQLHMLSSTLQKSGSAGIRAEAGLTCLLKDNARQQCQACLSSLTQILEDLSSRIQRSSGARRKVFLARQILRRDELAKIEQRLARAVGFLNMANQIYMIEILEAQRQDISYLLSNKSTTVEQRAINPTSNSGLKDNVPDSLAAWKQGSKDVLSLSTASINRAFHLSSGSQQPEIEWSWEIGIACITGTLGVKTYQLKTTDQASMKSSEENREETKHVEPPCAAPKATIKITLPRCLSTQVIDWLLYRTQVGWSHLLRARNNLQAADSLRYDLAPWDEVRNGMDLFSPSTGGKLRICSYLLDCGVEPYAKVERRYRLMPAFALNFYIEDLLVPSSFVFTVQDDRNLDYQQLVRQIDQNDSLADALLSYCKGGQKTFTTLRRSVWLDEEYYSEAFLWRRMSLAINIATDGVWAASPDDDLVGIIRVALDQQGVLKRAASDLTVVSNWGTLLHGLAGAIGLLEGHRSVSQWIELVVEVLKEAPSTQLLCQSLYESGVDLFEYGREEAKRHANYPGQAASFGIRRSFPVGVDRVHELCKLSLRFVQLISFEIGQLPSQWRFWWTEPTDEFAGDFWDLITEQEIIDLRVPGAWVEDA
ncbi:hypothetical protein LA080_007040 [Diaporthe eres]|nr:hypothetical protein LA080_007040 [Diaporthe eres]